MTVVVFCLYACLLVWFLGCVWFIYSAFFSRRRETLAEKSMHASLLLPEYIHDARLDRRSLFSFLPLDVIEHLCLFMPHRRGLVRNPALLCYSSTVMQNVKISGHISFDARGDIIAGARSQNELRVFSGEDGTLVRKLPPSQTKLKHKFTHACVEDSNGQFFVTTCQSFARGKPDCVKMLDCDGNIRHHSMFSSLINTEYRRSSKIEKRLFDVRGLALSNDESALFVCCHDHRACVLVLRTRDLSQRAIVGRNVLQNPQSVAVLSTDQIAVSCYCKPAVVQLFNTDGTLAFSAGEDVLSHPAQITVDARDNIYVAEYSKDAVFVFSAQGNLIHCIAGRLTSPYGIAISPAGVVAVSDKEGVKLFRCE